MPAKTRKCLHQDTYYEGDENGKGQERCRDCGCFRKPGTAKWLS